MTMAWNFVPQSGVGAAHAEPVQTILVDGAITIGQGTVFITKATAAAITIANPPTGVDGARLKIISTTAAAHTVTYTAGFGGGTTARDVATFGGAINDGFEIVAYQGLWYAANTRNVTIA